MGRLAGKTVFMTAAGSGIGGAAASAFACEGARVIATDASAATIRQKAAELAKLGDQHQAYVLDVTDLDALRNAAMRHGDIDILYNGAGWVHQGTLETTSLQDWQRSFDINVTPMFVAAQVFMPQFVERGSGNIINVASVASSIKAMNNRLAYMATKAAVIGLTKSIATDFMKHGVRANALCPGSVDSPSLHERAHTLGNHDEVWKTFLARQPMGRMAHPEEMAHLLVYLASDESSYATGSCFVADGGLSL